MMSSLQKGLEEYWAENKLAFSSFPKEDAQDLIKLMILHDINDRPMAGFVHLAKLELLTRAFPEDGLMIEIYNQLHARCNDAIVSMRGDNADSVIQHCFMNQPVTYDGHGNGTGYWYNVQDDKILNKLINKHPLLKGAIMGVVYR